jgi:putative hydrolase of the HAD superfamily
VGGAGPLLWDHEKAESGEEYPEIDVEAIWSSFLRQEGMEAPLARRNLATILAQIHRAISRKRLQLYPDVKRVLDELHPTYRMTLVSDAQPCYALPEIKAVGLEGYFDPIIISAQYGFRKPDTRLIGKALETMKLGPEKVICVGNDMFRDIYGASRLGIRTILVDSNQGAKSHENVTPDYFAHRFEDILKGIKALT